MGTKLATAAAMFTFTAHAIADTRLFADWTEASALWIHLVRRVHGLSGLVLMPNHLHLDHPSPDPRDLDAALQAWAQWRNAHRGERGPVWAPRPPPKPLSGPDHIRRNLRYLHLNPCRARLVGCPTAWPFSTYRDILGLAAAPVRARHPDPLALHSYTSGDPSCAVQGTPFPGHHDLDPRPDLDRLAGAVSEYLRVPVEQVRGRGRARRAFIGACRALTTWSQADLACYLEVHRCNVQRAPPLDRSAARQVARMAADSRFPGLVERDPRLGRGR